MPAFRDQALGALRLVQSFFGVLNVLLQILENYALPKAARLFKDSKEQSKHFLRQISIGGSVIFGIMLLILFVFSEQIITLAGGHQYAEFAFLDRLRHVEPARVGGSGEPVGRPSPDDSRPRRPGSGGFFVWAR